MGRKKDDTEEGVTVADGQEVMLEAAEHLGAGVKIAPEHGLAAMALSMAMKYHQMQMIPDGLTYQQYKMEGRNLRTIGLVDVFETAMQIEVHLLSSPSRLADMIASDFANAAVRVLEVALEAESEEEAAAPADAAE